MTERRHLKGRSAPRTYRCKVCNSPNRDEYEQLLQEDKSFRCVAAAAQSKGEDISYKAVQNHAEKHMVVMDEAVDKRLEKTREVEALAKKKLDAEQRFIKELDANLAYMKELRERLPKEVTTAAMVNATMRLMQESRITEEKFEQARERIKLPGDAEAVFADLKRALVVLCPECRRKVAEKLEGIDEGSITGLI